MRKSAFLLFCLVSFLVILGVLAGPALQADQKGKAQTLCPVTGQPITKSSYLDYEGRRVYFCCDGCKATFLKDPEKYLNKMKSEGIALEAVPAGKKNPE
jgi:YHS domain-containing protein